MPYFFHQLLDGKTGKPVLIPSSAPIVSIRPAADDDTSADAFWLEYVWHQSEHGEPKSRSVLVKGPIEDILASISAHASAPKSVTSKLDQISAERDETQAEAAQFERTCADLSTQLRDARSELALLHALDNEVKWTDVQRMGTPTIYSTFLLDSTSAARALRFFCTAVGYMGQGFCRRPMSFAHTNLKEPGRIPWGQAFQVFAMKVELIGGADSTVEWLKTNASLAWDFSQTTLDIGPLGAFEWDSTGRSGYITIGTVPTEEEPNPAAVVDDGTAPLNLFRYGRHGVLIPGGVTYALILRVNDRDEALVLAHDEQVMIRISLAGYYVSAIEVG